MADDVTNFRSSDNFSTISASYLSVNSAKSDEPLSPVDCSNIKLGAAAKIRTLISLLTREVSYR